MQIDQISEKEKIRNEIKAFFEKNDIDFQENDENISIKGELRILEYYHEVSLNLWLNRFEFLSINEFNGKLVLIFSKGKGNILEIPKDALYKIYYLNNKLIFSF